MLEVLFPGLGVPFQFCGVIGGVSPVGPSLCCLVLGRDQAQLLLLEFTPYRAEMVVIACSGVAGVTKANLLTLGGGHIDSGNWLKLLEQCPDVLLCGGLIEVCDTDPVGFPDLLDFSLCGLGLAVWPW